MAKKLFITKKPKEGLGTTRTIMLPIDKDRPHLGERETTISFDATLAETDFTEANLLKDVVEGDYVCAWADELKDLPDIHKVRG